MCQLPVYFWNREDLQTNLTLFITLKTPFLFVTHKSNAPTNLTFRKGENEADENNENYINILCYNNLKVNNNSRYYIIIY